MKRALFFLLLLACPLHAQSVRQNISSSGGTATFPSAVQPGNAFVATVMDELASGVPSVFAASDNNSDSWNLAGTVQSDTTIFGNSSIAIMYACNVTNTPNSTPTVTITDTQGTARFELFEVSGVASTCFDQVASNTATSGSATVPWSSGLITPTQPNSIVFGISFTGCTAIAYAAGGWTNGGMPGLLGGSAYQNISSTSPIAAQFVCSSGTNSKSLGVTANFLSGNQSTGKKLKVTQQATAILRRRLPVA